MLDYASAIKELTLCKRIGFYLASPLKSLSILKSIISLCIVMKTIAYHPSLVGYCVNSQVMLSYYSGFCGNMSDEMEPVIYSVITCSFDQTFHHNHFLLMHFSQILAHSWNA